MTDSQSPSEFGAWRMLEKVLRTNCVTCTNIKPNVHLREICYDCYYYHSFGPARPARDT